eukprot:gnl/MRDRNA2_/MRDRNA2_72164_c0_seq2.p1 gnl/MRDRNA2_/MRDRNA2_72164_c0~~gnl/MRDRNA2_/MRDRNA2_72164_c0_seq2.p1  ORF type:complete len:307 (+),score=80.96 gnl/MRDRNA2_/MRDRNA2_72164_c0_seq2:114-1034(+)
MPKSREELAEELRKMQAEFASLRQNQNALRNSVESFGQPGARAGPAQTTHAPQFDYQAQVAAQTTHAPQFDYQAQISQLLHGNRGLEQQQLLDQQQQQQLVDQQQLVEQQQLMQQQSAFQQQWQWQMQQQMVSGSSRSTEGQQYHEVAARAPAKRQESGASFTKDPEPVYDANQRFTGRIIKIYPVKEYGHIECRPAEKFFGRDKWIFFHRSAVSSGDIQSQRVQFNQAKVGDVVTFKVGFNKPGEKMADVPRAKDVLFEKIEFERWGMGKSQSAESASARPEPDAKRPRFSPAARLAPFSPPSIM